MAQSKSCWSHKERPRCDRNRWYCSRSISFKSICNGLIGGREENQISETVHLQWGKTTITSYNRLDSFFGDNGYWIIVLGNTDTFKLQQVVLSRPHIFGYQQCRMWLVVALLEMWTRSTLEIRLCFELSRKFRKGRSSQFHIITRKNLTLSNCFSRAITSSANAVCDSLKN